MTHSDKIRNEHNSISFHIIIIVNYRDKKLINVKYLHIYEELSDFYHNFYLKFIIIL